MLSGFEIEAVLRKDAHVKRMFRGVFPIDLINQARFPKTGPSIFIVNSDRSNEPGEHWLCVYFMSGKSEFMDSFGFPASHYPEIDTFIKRHCHVRKHNTRMLQSVLSDTCGLYCIYYAIQKSRGRSLRSIIAPFHPLNQQKNDMKIRRLLRIKFPGAL